MTELRKLLLTHRSAEIELAQVTLTGFMTARARQTAAEVGFGWTGTPDAPNDYATLQEAYRESQQTGSPLPVSSEHNQDVTYTTAETNQAFRFVHDVHHVKFKLSFEVVDELELAMWHLGELELLGFEPTSLPWRLLHADLVGQAFIVKLSGSFPPRQSSFIRGCLLSGFEHGLITEARALKSTNAQPGPA